jgi:hypothetical protein
MPDLVVLLHCGVKPSKPGWLQRVQHACVCDLFIRLMTLPYQCSLGAAMSN